MRRATVMVGGSHNIWEWLLGLTLTRSHTPMIDADVWRFSSRIAMTWSPFPHLRTLGLFGSAYTAMALF